MTSSGGQEVGRISIRVVPNTTRFRQDLQSDLERIEKTLKSEVAVEVNLDTLKARGDMSTLMAKLKAEGARGVTINTNLDKDKIGGFLSGVGSGAGGAVGSLGGMGRSLAIVAAVAAFLAPALALVSGVLITLPALITAVLVPIAAIALGMDGLKKAAEVLKDPLDNLKATMSTSFQERFTPIFTKLKDIFPVLNQEMPKISTGLGDMAEAFVKTATAPKGLEQVRGIISNIGTALSNSAPGIANFTDGFLTLVSKVSAKLPNLSTIFNGWGDSFSGWVNKITTKDWWGSSPLDKGLKSFKDTLTEVLNIVGDLATKGFEFLSDPDFGNKMQEFVASMKTLVNDILPGLGSFFKDISGAITDITGAIHSFDDKNQLAAKAENIKQGIDNKDKGAGDANLPAWIDFEGWGISIRQWFSKVAGEVGAWSSEWWTNMKAGAVGMWDDIAGAASSAWSSVVSAVQTATSSIGTFFAGVPGALSSAWSSLSSVASSAWSGVTSAVSSAWESIKSAVSTGVDSVIGFVSGMGGKIISAITSIDLGSAGGALMDGLLGGIRAGAQKVYDFVSGIAATIAKLKGPLPYDRTVLTPNGQALMQGLQDGIEGGFEGVINRAKQLAGEISDAINSGGPISLGFKDQLKRQMDEIGLENDALKNQQNATDDKGQKNVLRDQRSQLQTLRDTLKEQQDQLGYSEKYGDSVDKNKISVEDQLTKMVDAGKGFAMANANQLMSDLGIGGQGAIPTLLKMGADFGQKFVFNVSNIDEAMQVKRTESNVQALQHKQR